MCEVGLSICVYEKKCVREKVVFKFIDIEQWHNVTCMLIVTVVTCSRSRALFNFNYTWHIRVYYIDSIYTSIIQARLIYEYFSQPIPICKYCPGDVSKSKSKSTELS